MLSPHLPTLHTWAWEMAIPESFPISGLYSRLRSRDSNPGALFLYKVFGKINTILKIGNFPLYFLKFSTKYRDLLIVFEKYNRYVNKNSNLGNY